MTTTLPEKVTKEVAETLLGFQKRCIYCGASYPLHIHHRIFRSEGESFVKQFLEKALPIYEQYYGRVLEPWGLHSIQNLCVLCINCHEGDKVGVHGGNEKLRLYLRNTFTCPRTGFNVPYKKLT